MASLQTPPPLMALQHFFADGEYLGARTIPDMRVVTGLEVRRHFSYGYYCGRCGEIWGRLLHDGASYTQLTHLPCRQHGGGLLSCHPAWFDMPTRFEFDWPIAATKREFNILLAEALQAIQEQEQESE